MRSPSTILVVKEEEGASMLIVPCAKSFERLTAFNSMKSSEGSDAHGSDVSLSSLRIRLFDVLAEATPLADPHVSSELTIAPRSIDAEYELVLMPGFHFKATEMSKSICLDGGNPRLLPRFLSFSTIQF